MGNFWRCLSGRPDRQCPCPQPEFADCSVDRVSLPDDLDALIVIDAAVRSAPDEPLERIKNLMAAAQDPRAREQIAAYRRFLEQIIHAAYLKDADIVNVLRLLAEVSGENIVASDDVKGKITLHLSEVPWDQALDIVMDARKVKTPAYAAPICRRENIFCNIRMM